MLMRSMRNSHGSALTRPGHALAVVNAMSHLGGHSRCRRLHTSHDEMTDDYQTPWKPSHKPDSDRKRDKTPFLVVKVHRNRPFTSIARASRVMSRVGTSASLAVYYHTYGVSGLLVLKQNPQTKEDILARLKPAFFLSTPVIACKQPPMLFSDHPLSLQQHTAHQTPPPWRGALSWSRRTLILAS
ncbi:hypothetical protein CPB85DRAFT_1324092 [Mucidula mucida]|nr:hypothetical protein CPB85DRAFT_1337560 [Mucidula mucida]KAF8901223.1 hypothetical protein CPB85DRAFT_1324092 [Mucidula mucida]